MAQKIFNSFLIIIFITLVALFAYKQSNNPPQATASLRDIAPVAAASSNNSDSLSKQEIEKIVEDYILNNPGKIIQSLEGMQKKKLQESAKVTSEYLSKNKDKIENVDSPPFFGNKDGDIKIVVFYDYNCSYCRKGNQYTNDIVKSDPNVKVILRPIPILGGTSMYAAKVALAVQKISQEKFPAIHNDLMSMKSIDERSVKVLMSKHGIDYSIVENEVNSHALKQLITKNFELAKGLGINGAPSYIVNGNFIPGLIPVERFKAMILQIRADSNSK